MSDRYQLGLRHGYEDVRAIIRRVVESDQTDARKLEEIAHLVQPWDADEKAGKS